MSLDSVSFRHATENDQGQRIDNYLIKTLKGAPKSLIYKIIRKGEVRVNKKRVKAEYKLKEGDLIRIPPVRLGESAPIAPLSDAFQGVLRQALLFENDQFMVVNKPSGMAVHAGSGIQVGLIEALRQLAPLHDYRELVHRLDRGTSGCILIAKKKSMLKYLQDLLRENHRIEKQYLALVDGRWPTKVKLVDFPLKRRELASGEHVVNVSTDGKPSQTQFRTIETFNDATLVSASPITGRTHQIRVHAQYMKHSLLGDDKYTDRALNEKWRQLGLNRLFLHAHRLRFPLPNGEIFTVEAPLPDKLETLLARLRA